MINESDPLISHLLCRRDTRNIKIESNGTAGEYNGKFVSGRVALWSDSCVAPADRIRCHSRRSIYSKGRWHIRYALDQEPMKRNPAAKNFYDAHPGKGDLRREVIDGLASKPKSIPPKFFYDRRGSELFDAICELPEYYQTRTEMEILRNCVAELVEHIGPDCLLVELGSGASKKVRLLLEQLRPSSYLGVDISKEFLLHSTQVLASDYPWLDVHAACVDFSHTLDMPHCDAFEHKVAFFPGSSIGNFDPNGAIELMKRIAQMMDMNGQLLIGVDLKKNVDILNAAYNDAAGITADFNLNLLTRIRQELDSDIDPKTFEHSAFYNEDQGRIEMHLISTVAQRIRIDDHFFDFDAGETIHTENSYKYTVEEFAQLAAAAGFNQERVWTDESKLFSVQLLRTV